MSVPYLRLLALALLLQGCATTDSTTADRSSASANSATAKAQSLRAPLPPSAIDSEEQDFKGPQVVFAPGSSEVPRTAAPLLDNIASRLKADPLNNVVLIGHTEDMGSTEFSMAIATKCTQAVGLALIKRGARPNQIRMQARGNEKTASKRCTTAACKKQMRRVDIVMSEY